MLQEGLERIRVFRDQFKEFREVHATIMETLPGMLTKLYSDCQAFAESEIKLALERFNKETSARQLRSSNG
jgi:hypothetical protein